MTPQIVRDLLVSLTGLIPDEEIAGYCFIAGLVFTDHVSLVVHRLIG